MMVNNDVGLLDSVKRAKAELEYVEKVLFGAECTGMVEKTDCTGTIKKVKPCKVYYVYDIYYGIDCDEAVFSSYKIISALKKNYEYLHILNSNDDKCLRLYFTNEKYEGVNSVCNSFKLNDIENQGLSLNSLEDKLLFIYNTVQEIIVELKTNLISDEIYSLTNKLYDNVNDLDVVDRNKKNEVENIKDDIAVLSSKIHNRAYNLNPKWQELGAYELTTSTNCARNDWDSNLNRLTFNYE